MNRGFCNNIFTFLTVLTRGNNRYSVQKCPDAGTLCPIISDSRRYAAAAGGNISGGIIYSLDFCEPGDTYHRSGTDSVYGSTGLKPDHIEIVFGRLPVSPGYFFFSRNVMFRR